jgi:hypothetical protein
MLALAAGGGADFSGRSLPGKQEELVGGYLRAGAELRFPVGRVTFRAGAGGRAGLLFQTISPTGTPAAKDETKSALAFGPEAVLGARLALGPTWFVDLAATGDVSFVREEGSVEGIAGGTGALSLGARF